uniref:helix-turn-helix transcriptional regulator n=1 Tax=Pararhizobium sp. IMCC3301 TaxID=3067904 RepID=UPI00274133E8|nr:helix-turn-helix transcriptional regulator [Pararhizobium sp. IMCC3301]
MTEPQFLTTRELAELLRVKERKIYDLANAGELPCRRVTGKLLFPKSEIDAWLSDTAQPVATAATTLPNIVAGSHDPLLEWAIRESGCGLATFFDGSMDGIKQLQAGQALAAGLHLVEENGREWNLSFVREAFANAAMVLMQWAEREQGLILSRALQNVTSLSDLKGLRIAQRQPASGAGRLFHHALHASGMGPEDFEIPADFARTETDAALAVVSGRADAAPGLAGLARQFDLGFLPIATERYDLLIDRRSWFEPPMQTLLSFCRSLEFRQRADELGGYHLTGHGKIHWNG